MDEQVALVDRSAHGGECRAGHHALYAERVGQCLADRTDVAVGRGVEGGAVLEDDLGAALLEEPVQSRKRLFNRFRCG